MFEDKIIAWYDYKNREHKWRLVTTYREMKEVEEKARKECDSYFKVMIFDMKDVLNKG